MNNDELNNMVDLLIERLALKVLEYKILKDKYELAKYEY